MMWSDDPQNRLRPRNSGNLYIARLLLYLESHETETVALIEYQGGIRRATCPTDLQESRRKVMHLILGEILLFLRRDSDFGLVHALIVRRVPVKLSS